MTKNHVKEFLRRFSAEDLTDKGVLRGGTRLLNGRSLRPLVEMMIEQRVTCLEAPERNWLLTTDGEFRNPLSTEIKSGSTNDLENPGNVFNEQNTSINPYYVRNAGPELDSEEGSEELRFGLEKDLQKALRANIQQLEQGLRIIDDGVERTVESGRIDITAEDSNGQVVVIELKAGRAELASIAQLLSYMGGLNMNLGQTIRGVIVASDFHPRLVAAARAVPNISLVAYSFQFLFCER